MHDFSGTWNADLIESSFVGPRPAGLSINIDHREIELREELIITKADGTETRAEFVCHTNGEDGT